MNIEDLKKEIDEMRKEVSEKKDRNEGHKIEIIILGILKSLKHEVFNGRGELIYSRADLKPGCINLQEESLWKQAVDILKEAGLYARLREVCRNDSYERWEFSLEPF